MKQKLMRLMVWVLAFTLLVPGIAVQAAERENALFSVWLEKDNQISFRAEPGAAKGPVSVILSTYRANGQMLDCCTSDWSGIFGGFQATVKLRTEDGGTYQAYILDGSTKEPLLPCQTGKFPPAETVPDGAKTISFVVKAEPRNYWRLVKAGAEAAGKEKGYNITFSNTKSNSAEFIPEQIELARVALSNQADGMVLAAIGSGFTGLLRSAYDRKIPVVQIESGVSEDDIAALGWKTPIVSHVTTTDRIAAATAAEKLFTVIREEIAHSQECYHVGVIQYDESRPAKERAIGFMDRFWELAKSDVATADKFDLNLEVKPYSDYNAYGAALEALNAREVSAIFMTNEIVVNQVYDEFMNKPEKYGNITDIKFVGFDSGTRQIQWMKAERGPKLLGSVAQDPFTIGYEAAMQCIHAIENETVEKTVPVGGVWYDLQNVDDMLSKGLVVED